VFLSDEEKHYRLLATVRRTLRNHVPLDSISAISDPFFTLSANSLAAEEEKAEMRNVQSLPGSDFGSISLFHKVSPPTLSLPL
jgi:hypothetical protein